MIVLRETVAVSGASHLDAVIFDFDGLMIDSERVEADLVIEVLAEWGVTVTYRDFGHLFGSVDADEQWNDLLAERCGRTAADLDDRIRANATVLKDELPLMPGVRELLDAAGELRLRLALATGNTLSTLETRLGRHAVFHRFDAIVTRAEVASGKPAPDVYLEAARRLGVAPDRCLVLEDSVVGCEAALAASMRVIACPTVVTQHCQYPKGAQVVTSLLDVCL